MKAHAGPDPDSPGPSLSVVVPVYNSSAGLRALVDRLAPVLAGCCFRYELVLVNDGSGDGSWAGIECLCREHAWVQGIDLMRNYGQHAALLRGIRAARYPLIATMDDDLQNPPEEIPRLLEALAAGHDVVYGKPRVEQHGLWRDAASKLIKIGLSRVMGAELAANVSAFRLFRAEVRSAFEHYDGPFVSIDVLLSWGTRRFGVLAVDHHPRRQGASQYTLRKLVHHSIDLITGFSTLPLRLATFIGFLFTLFGLLVLAYVTCRYLLSSSTVPGFTFLASIISVFAGAQLCALGIIGEYLARMHFRSMGVPSSVVRRRAPSRETQAKRAGSGDGT